MPPPSVADFELAVLLAVARLGSAAHGLAVRRQVGELRGRDYSVGAVYTALQRLEAKGALSSTTTAPLPVRGGRSRREYRVTAAGRRAIEEARAQATRLWALGIHGARA